jgi:hypothetical protein
MTMNPPVLRVSDEELERVRVALAEAGRRMYEATAPLRQIAERLAAPQDAEPLPPLAELVTDEDVRVALHAYLGVSGLDEAMRAALEAYGARLLARHGRTT